MFKRDKDPQRSPVPPGRYRVVLVTHRQKGNEDFARAVQEALNEGAEAGWALACVDSTNVTGALLYWDTEPA